MRLRESRLALGISETIGGDMVRVRHPSCRGSPKKQSSPNVVEVEAIAVLLESLLRERRAGDVAAQPLESLGDRRYEADALERTKDARRTRARAYALFMDAYDTCQQGVTFLRWKQGDVDRYVPSIHPRRPRRPETDEPEALVDPSTAAEPTPEPTPPQALAPADALASA